MDSSSEGQEIDLFSIWKKKMKRKRNRNSNFRYRRDGCPVQDFVFPNDLEDFYPKTNREKLKRISPQLNL